MSVSFRVSKGHVIVGLLVALVVSLISSPVLAQSDSTPKWDLFAGYQWAHPGGYVPAPFGDYNNPTALHVPDMSTGFGASFTYNYDSHFGLEVDLGHNWGNSNYETTVSAGPRLMFRTSGANFFLHTMIGDNRLSINGLNAQNGFGAIGGGGMDLPIKQWLAFRLFEADFVYGRHNYSGFVSDNFPNLLRPTFDGVRLRTGFVFSWGGAPEAVPAASCTVQPSEVMVGEPITVTVAATNFNPKHTVTYAWSANGGQVTGTGTTAQIDTNNVAPGSYAVTAHVTDAKLKTGNEASCTANFTVKPLPPKNPPTMSISANPPSVPVGGTVSLSANCTSPDNVPINVATWTSTGGTISGTGTSATLNTAGASPGSISVSAICTDSRGLTGQASTQVMVENPPPPPPNPEIQELEARLALHSIYFVTATPTIANPNGGLVASQRQTLTGLATDFKKYLQSKPDAHLILGGHADHRGSEEFNKALTERRVARVKAFLVEQGIPEGNIDTQAFGKDDNMTTDQVKDTVENDPNISAEERQRILRNIVVIRMASNRRVDVTLSTTGQTSVRQFPFNAADSLTLIGGREGAAKPKTTRPAPRKRAPKKQQ